MEMETPAETIVRWLNKPGPKQAIVRWIALTPGAVCIFLFFQLTLLIALSLIARSGDGILISWAMNMLNAAFVPVLIIKYGTPIAPSFRQRASVALAVVAVFLVGVSRLAFELSNPHQSDWRYAWLAIAAALCGASVLFGIRGVIRKESLRDQAGADRDASYQ
jgi:hypothetical protein